MAITTKVDDDRIFIAKRIAAFFNSGDVVNLGVGIPVLVSNYTHEGVWIQSENGILGVGAAAKRGIRKVESYCNAAGDEIIPVKGACTFDVSLSFGMMRSGRVDASVLGAIEVASNGDLANWAMPGRSPGMGGAMDIVSGVKTVYIATTHCTKDGKPKILEKCTLPLTGLGVVDYIVTEYCVMHITDGKMILEEIRNNITVDELKKITGAPFEVATDLKEMKVD
ncbi:MAG: succinyl-CoA--3-ketoacid-CoA transferase [Eubacterium sp.]|nr:succinyl-CoA--3-ketoacid-CoA transferase [Eubacterium sp.]